MSILRDKTSIAFSVSKSSNYSLLEFESKIREVSEEISNGGYLFLLTEYSQHFQPTVSYESLALRTLMGSPLNRNTDWLFFGNGVIRGYTPAKKKLSSTWQWVILQKSGERTLAKRHTSSQLQLSKSAIPVSHPAFTRDVANNVWHLNESTLIKTSLHRFRALLTWPDEQLIHFHNLQKKTNIPYLKMDLSQDLIGVAEKSIYYWDSLDTLF